LHITSNIKTKIYILLNLSKKLQQHIIEKFRPKVIYIHRILKDAEEGANHSVTFCRYGVAVCDEDVILLKVILEGDLVVGVYGEQCIYNGAKR